MAKTSLLRVLSITLCISCVASNALLAQTQKDQPKIESATIDGKENRVIVVVRNAPEGGEWYFRINDKNIEAKPESDRRGGRLHVTAAFPDWQRMCPVEKQKVGVFHEDVEIGTVNAERLLPPATAGTQPYIACIRPEGGPEGSEISIIGNNLGKDTGEVLVCLYRGAKEGGDVSPEMAAPIPVIPLSLSAPQPEKPEKKGRQELKFLIPEEQNLSGQILFPNTMQVRIIVNGQSSGPARIKVVGKNFYNWLIVPALILLGLLAYVIFLFVRRRGIKIETFFIDKKTNTYSLSKCQAIAWTAVLVGSYFYYAIGSSIIIERGVIPDFNASLLPLLGISYSGLLIARSIGTFIPKNDLEVVPPSLKDLVCEGGEISINRLQLVCFNITGILIYLYNLSGPNLLIKGLPNIPETLLGLLGVSQGGYLLGKVTGGRTAVNYARPRYVRTGTEGTKLTLIGSGFLANTKVLIQDVAELKDTVFQSESSLSIDLPKISKRGAKQIVLVPPTGSSIVIDNVFEVVDLQIEKVKRVAGSTKQVKVIVKGYDLQQPPVVTIDNQPATLKETDMLSGTITVEAQTDIADTATIKVSLEDGAISAEAKVSG